MKLRVPLCVKTTRFTDAGGITGSVTVLPLPFNTTGSGSGVAVGTSVGVAVGAGVSVGAGVFVGAGGDVGSGTPVGSGAVVGCSAAAAACWAGAVGVTAAGVRRGTRIPITQQTM